jgi:hypothetical protein
MMRLAEPVPPGQAPPGLGQMKIDPSLFLPPRLAGPLGGRGPTMSARSIAWYTSAMFAAGTFLVLLVSVAPGAEFYFFILQSILAAFAVFFAAIGVVLGWLPQDHWFNRSPAVRGVLVFAALCGTLLLLASVG